MYFQLYNTETVLQDLER